MKLHPSIVITRKADGNHASVSVAGDMHRNKLSNVSADEYAAEVSGILWSIEVSEKPAKPRPTRIWDEAGWA